MSERPEAPDASAPDAFQAPEAPEPRRSRLPVLLAVLAAVLALGLAVLVPVLVQRVRASQEPNAAADLEAVRVFEDLANNHTDGDRNAERRLKNCKNSPRLCPVCNAEKEVRRAA